VNTGEWKDLDEFLFARAMEHDSPKLLYRLACEYLLSSRVIRPGVILLLRRVAAARARTETWSRIRHLLTEGGAPSSTCCWSRTPISAGPRWPGWAWARPRRARPQ
jgi:hypothetical protein